MSITEQERNRSAKRERPAKRRGMTDAELYALPVSFGAAIAFTALDISRDTGYELIKNGQFPCRVLRLGNSYRIAKADLLRVLGVDEHAGAAA